MSGAEQAVVTDLDEARREDVLEEATNEPLRRDRALLKLIGGGFFVGESDLAIMARGPGGPDQEPETFSSKIADKKATA